MTYPPGPTLWVSGQRLDAADLNNWTQNLPWGIVTSATITSASSAFTTIADISGLSVTFTAIADRYYVVSFCGHVVSTAAADRVDVQICDGANTVLRESIFYIPANSMNVTATFNTPPLEPGAGSITYKIRAERATGTGTCTIGGSTTTPTTLIVTDVGSAA